jgi:TetR/AcrR family transcriptional regulator, transcriptional repressor for nem operon
MTRLKADKNRQRLVRAATKASYRHGFGHTALADIAKEARVPLGNVYYYFKTKDEIAAAIIELRLSRFKKLLADLDEAESPGERLCAFVDIKIKNRESLARLGCPVGTLCSELGKNGGPAAAKSAGLLAEALAWMETQFQALGQGAESKGLALHLLSATQGISLLAHTLRDPQMIVLEAARLKKWIRAI